MPIGRLQPELLPLLANHVTAHIRGVFHFRCADMGRPQAPLPLDMPIKPLQKAEQAYVPKAGMVLKGDEQLRRNITRFDSSCLVLMALSVF